MRAHRPCLALFSLSFVAGLGQAQQPAHEVDPAASYAPAPESITGVDCNLVIGSTDISLATGDIRILGVAKSESNGKWFFSGSNNAAATNTMWIFDSDELGRPNPTSMRSVGQSPLRVSAFWGHRDGEWDPIGGKTYWGDEAAKIMEFDPFTEAWTGNAWALPAFGAAVVRGLAVISDPLTGNLRAYGCDFGGQIQEYILAPGTGATSTVISGPRSVAPSPGSTYGIAIVDGPAGPYSALAVFGQLAMTCTPGVGLHRVTVVDIATGNTLWTRSGDFSLPGATPNLNGGIAGGIQLANVAGQPVLAAVHQANSDAVAYLPITGFAKHGADECNSAYLYMTGSPALNGSTGFAVANGLPNGLALVYIDTNPGFGLPIGCGLLNVGIGFQPFLFPTDATGRGSIGPFAIPGFPFFDGVVLYSDAILADISGLASTNPLEILLTRRCW
ncbi:MAG: hypothetical protein IPN34_09420 [Planctomycetes bacterium]|nr:hypothetical protein [Planctomycetota bacterium]